MRFLFRVAWRNLWRNRRRTLITASMMAIGVGLCLPMVAFSDGFYAMMTEVMVDRKMGHVQVHHPDYPAKKLIYDTVDEAGPLAASIRELPLTTGVAPRLMGYGLVAGASSSAGGQIRGVHPEAEDAVSGLSRLVTDGAYFQGEDLRQALLGEQLADDIDVSVGDGLVVLVQSADGSMGNDLLRVQGIVRSGSTMLDKGAVWVPLGFAQELFVLPDQVHELIVVGQDMDQAPALRDAVKAQEHAGELLVRSWDEVDPMVAQTLGMQTVGSLIFIGIVYMVAAIGILNTMLMAVFERVREFGLLRALGFSRGRLVALIILEAVLIAGVGAIGGALLGGLLDIWVVGQGIDFSVNGEGLAVMGVQMDPTVKGVVSLPSTLMTLVLVFVIAAFAAVWPAIKAALLRPVDAMRSL